MNLKAYIYALGTAFLLIACFRLATALDGIRVELDRTCFVGVPQRPETGLWHLKWVRGHK